jgi:predicted Zn-dependent peptidase
MAAVFPEGHPYHHTPIGSMEDLDAASLDDVIAFFRTWYAPNNCVLTIAGDVDEEPAFAAAERYLGPIAANPDLPSWTPPPVAPVIGAGTRDVVEEAVPLVRVHFGWRIPPYGSDAFDALEIGTHIMAGGRGSRMYQRLVRDERVAQDVAAFTLPLIGNASILAGWVTVRPEADPAAAERSFMAEVQKLCDELVTDDELARARALVESAELGALSRMEEVADRLSQFATYFDRPELINEQLSRYLAIDAAQIQAVARQVFRPDNLAVITYVPAEPAEEAA